MTIPTRLLSFISRWFDPATVHRTFEPLIADWQREWIDAPRSRRWLVQIKGIVACCIAAAVSTPAIIHTRAPKSLTWQIARRIAIGTALGTMVFALPFTTFNFAQGSTRLLLLVVALPQALTLVFPFALLSAVDAIRRFDGIEAHTARATVAKLSVLGVLFVFCFHGWVVPAANQVYREVASSGRFSPAPGIRELTNQQLIARLAVPASEQPGTYQYQVAMTDSIRRELNNRATLALLPVLLVWRRWRVLDLPRGRWFSPWHPAIASIATLALFILLRGFLDRQVERAWQLPVGSGPWITLLVIALLGTMRVTLSGRSQVRA